MTATELRALERFEMDAHYLAQLIERTMVVDAKLSTSLVMTETVHNALVALNQIEAWSKTGQRIAVRDDASGQYAALTAPARDAAGGVS